MSDVLPPLPPGVRVIHVDDLKTLLEAAAEKGGLAASREVLATLGIKPDDDEVAVDLKELRGWVRAMRLAKSEAFKVVVRTIAQLALAAIAIGALMLLKDKFKP